MADPKYLRIPMHQGLLESQESSKVPIGFMTELVNWVPEQTGGLRARGKWLKGSEDGLPATRQNRGIGTFNRFTDPAIVQSAFAQGTATPYTPSLTWATPTTAGNTLVAFISVSEASAGTVTFTATGWTARKALSTTWTANTGQTGIYELANAASFSGAITPFVFASSTATGHVSVWIFELVGVSGFDLTANATSSTQSVTVTTGATTQASEIIFAVDTLHQTTTTPVTLSTASTGWTEYAEDDHLNGLRYHASAVYTQTVRATGAQSITIDSSAASNNLHYGAVIAYKGWNPDPTPPEANHLLLAANYTGSTADVYSVGRDDLDTSTFTAVDSGLPSTGEPIAFVMGMGAAHYTASSFAGVRRYDGATATTISGSPVGARCIAINHDRMWVGGTLAYPSRLSYSQLLDALTWTGTGTGYWDIGTDDGEVIEDITPFNGGLLIGKETSLWFLSGSTTSDFARNPLPTGGAAPGRSLLTTPFGAVIAGTDQVWLYDGDTVQRLGNAIEVSYGPTGYVTTSYQDGSIYIADHTAGRVYAFNLGGPVGTWRVEECEDEIGTLYNVGGRQFMGPYSTTVGSLVNYRDFPAPARGKDYDPLGMSYRMRTGDLWVDGALHPSTPRQMYLQLRQRGGDPADPGLVVTPVFNGVDANDCDVGADNPGTRRVKVQGFPQKHRVGSFGFGITQTLETGDASVFDIEDAWVEYIQESTL